ncbi:YdcF family protein [Streptomonospora litoralis]|uniref:YdcF family protein n=1 Tax=Streptomonospora litoralis TaxID=2498135 RepID=UPI001F6250F0|nr:YdcF family protein [Streptomonospora litoralis]
MTAHDRIHTLTRRLWDFHTAPAQAPGTDCDLLLVLGSHDLRVAEHAARLYRDGAAPLLLFTGDRGRRTAGDATSTRWPRSEAHTFARAARQHTPIPDAALLLETRATNTGENFHRARDLLHTTGRTATRAAVTAKPYMARRALATAAVHWPEPHWTFTCFGGGYDAYPAPDHPRGELVHFLVGDLQRLAVYARRGWSAPVDVPADVWQAYDALVAAGYTGHLLSGEPARTAHPH